MANDHPAARIGKVLILKFDINLPGDDDFVYDDDDDDFVSGVFYCGSATLTKTLRELCQEFSLETATRFEFHKENF